MSTADPQFLFWGTAYVVVKWTIGLWLVRRAKAYMAGRWNPTTSSVSS